MSMATPPSGRGAYIYAQRHGTAYAAKFDFAAITTNRAGWERTVAELHERGKDVWLFKGAYDWTPTLWRQEIAFHLEASKRLPVKGFIVDAENGWQDLYRRDREAGLRETRALCDAIRSCVDQGVRVGFTSFPHISMLGAMGSLRGYAWGSPQFYLPRNDKNHVAADPATWAPRVADWARWTAIFGIDHVIPSVAVWQNEEWARNGAPPPDRTNYPIYLKTLPARIGSIAWVNHSTPSWMLAAYLEWRVVEATADMLTLTPFGLLLTRLFK